MICFVISTFFALLFFGAGYLSGFIRGALYEKKQKLQAILKKLADKKIK